MKKYILIFFCLSLFIGCVDEEERPNTPEGNFEALWKIMDEHYCFFDYKNIDWNAVYNIYKVRARGDCPHPLTTGDTGDGTRTTRATSATPFSADIWEPTTA